MRASSLELRRAISEDTEGRRRNRGPRTAPGGEGLAIVLGPREQGQALVGLPNTVFREERKEGGGRRCRDRRGDRWARISLGGQVVPVRDLGPGRSGRPRGASKFVHARGGGVGGGAITCDRRRRACVLTSDGSVSAVGVGSSGNRAVCFQDRLPRAVFPASGGRALRLVD